MADLKFGFGPIQGRCDNGHALSRTSAWQRHGHKVLAFGQALTLYLDFKFHI
jgi:hypothetical protein